MFDCICFGCCNGAVDGGGLISVGLIGEDCSKSDARGRLQNRLFSKKVEGNSSSAETLKNKKAVLIVYYIVKKSYLCTIFKVVK